MTSIAIPGSPLSDDELRRYAESGSDVTTVRGAVMRGLCDELLARRELEAKLAELGAVEMRVLARDEHIYVHTTADKRWHIHVIGDHVGLHPEPQPSITAALLAAIEAIGSHREGASMLQSRGGR